MDTVKSILYVLPSIAIGGAETRFFNIIKEIPGVRSVLMTNAPVAEYFSRTDTALHTFEQYGCSDPMPFSFRNTIRYARAIAETARNERIDCMVGVMHTGTFYAAAARDISRLRVPLVGTILGNISAFFHSEKRSPTLVEKSLLWYLLRRPSLIVTPSEGVKRDLIKTFGVSEKKISVIYNGIDINRVRKMAQEPPDTPDVFNGKTIVTSCRLNAQKDFTTLLKAFREIRKTMESRLIIVGDGELREEIIRLAETLGLSEDVVITGFKRNPFRFLKAADVFVLSSFFEGFGNVIVEAMALGIPVVATDCPSGPAEIIQNGVNGLLVPVMDYHRMAEAILNVLTDETVWKEFAFKGMERAEVFQMNDMVESYRRLITELLESATGNVQR
jgi:glycosyltransferase involved in cell wall biosynthesis